MSVNKFLSNKVNRIFIIIGLLLFVPVIVKFYFDFIRDNSYNKNESSISSYNYKLNDNDTSLYKTNFKELENILNEDSINYINYAKSLSKLFVIDVFNLDNKLTSTDIGGVDFVYNDLVSNFKENMGNGLYSFIESNIDGNRNQELPIVKSVDVNNVFETKYTYNDKEYDAYLVSLNWQYEKDLGYQSSIKLTLIKDDNKLYVVKGE